MLLPLNCTLERSAMSFYTDSPWEGSRAEDHWACRASASWGYCV